MTATLEHTDTEEAVEEEFKLDEPIPCTDLSVEGECQNPAVYMCRPFCCEQRLPFCEECLLNFAEWAKNVSDFKPTLGLVCNYCGAHNKLTTNYLIVLWRIR